MTTTAITALRSLRLKHFKRFSDASFELRPLTLLTGLNGTGKSTLIQALLLAGHAAQAGNGGMVALNNPPFVQLGLADDVFTFGDAAEAIEIGLDFADGADWLLSLHRSGDPLRLSVQTSTPPERWKGRIQFPQNQPWIAYLGAERLGPRLNLPMSGRGEGAFLVGSQGELTADCLNTNQTHKVSAGRRHPMSQSGDDDALITLPKQAELWMAELVPGLGIKATFNPDALQASLRFTTRDLGNDWVRPTNMGFGVSYALPVIVQGLLMAPGSILVVENPEAHLHPAGQSAIGRFLALCAADGVQVLVETHSDHILNGIRLAVKRDDIRPEATQVHFFERRLAADGSAVPAVTSPRIDRQGRFDRWPQGFFDEWERSLDALIDES